MYMRVAFAAAIAVDPDILIVDEALAVGDARFQNKCYARFENLQKRGCTILFVTHSIDLVSRFCTRGIVLASGRISHDGATLEATEHYNDLLYGKARDSRGTPPASTPFPAGSLETTLSIYGNGRVDQLAARAYYNPSEVRTGTQASRIIDIVLQRDGLELENPIYQNGERINGRIVIANTADVETPHIGLIIKTKNNQTIHGTTSLMKGNKIKRAVQDEIIEAAFEIDASLVYGEYFMDFGFADLDENGNMRVLDWRMSAIHFTVRSRPGFYGLADLNSTIQEIRRFKMLRP
jgi:lipopolysaccharide transport system ATP-binding protein